MKTTLFLVLCALLSVASCNRKKPIVPEEPSETGSPPHAPQLAAPADKSAGVSTTPRLYWKPDSLAERYALQVSENKYFTSFIFNSDTLTWNNQLLSGLSDTLRYYWRVRAINKSGTSPWSEVWSFTTLSATLRYIGGYVTPGQAWDVVIAGNCAYVANGYHGLRIIDISNPASPREIGYCDTPGHAEDVAVYGNYAYIADGYCGIRVINISNINNPFEVGFFNIYSPATYRRVHGVAASGNYIYIVDNYNYLRIIDVNDPSNPIEISNLSTSTTPYDIILQGNHAYLAEWGGTLLQTIDISNPLNPVKIGRYDAPQSGYDVCVEGSHAFVADGEYGMRILDVSNPSNPFEVGYYDKNGWVRDVNVAGKYAYMANQDSGLRVADISDLSDPIELGFYRNDIYAVNLVVIDNYIYVAEYGRGLKIYQVSFSK